MFPSELRIGYLRICKPQWWLYCWRSRNYCGLFRNSPGILPGRWGFFVLGFEFGSRNPGDPVGVWLYQLGLVGYKK